MVSLLVATAALFSGGIAQVSQDKAQTTPALVVTGSSEVRVAPDLATLQIGVTAQAKTAQEALDQANKSAQGFLDKAKTMLGAKVTVQTGSINLYPVFSEQNRPSNEPFTPQITGYRAENTLSVRTTDFSLVGPLIDTAVAAGLTNVSSINFGLQDDTDARLQALGNAVKQARKKAEVMADAAGVELSGIWQISENGARVMPFEVQPMAAMAGRGAAPTPVEPGAVSVSGDVTIKFFIKAKG